MGFLFKNDFHNEFGSWPLAYIPYGGADFGEIQAVGKAVGDGDDSRFYEAFMTAGDRFVTEGNEYLAIGNKEIARELLLKASEFYATAWHPIYGEPVDPRVIKAYDNQVASFDKAMSLTNKLIKQIRIPFQSFTMPAYFIAAPGRADKVGPLLILTNGYDATITDMYFATAVAAGQRGYHCLLFDGPGQGELLVKQGVPLRADWENVVKAVVDIAVIHPLVDKKRIAISGWSLGGYLAPRAASGEHRLAACIADPAQASVADGFRRAAVSMLHANPDTVTDLGKMDDGLLNQFESLISKSRQLQWSIVQRGFWVNGAKNLREYFASTELYTMNGRESSIQCPTLVTIAENDGLAAGAKDFYDKLTCKKTLLTFPADRGAGDHCEMMNRTLLNRKVFDWLDSIFRK